MKIDSAIKNFTEKYDREAIESIERISKDYGMNIKGYTIKGFNLSESFDRLNKYLIGYSDYKITYMNDPKASPQESIQESANNFIANNIFEPKDIRYSDLPILIESYVNGIDTLMETIDNIKCKMTEAGVQQEAIGDVNDFVDKFMDKLHESFDPMMDRILWASGYNSRKRLNGKNKPEPKPIFL